MRPSPPARWLIALLLFPAVLEAGDADRPTTPNTASSPATAPGAASTPNAAPVTAPAGAPAKTTIRDAAARDRLLGKHKLALQWISWDYFGEANVADTGGVLTLKGEQKQKDGGNYLTIDGVILEVDKTSFTFEGVIVTRIDHIFNGQACERRGRFTFQISGKRKYWRLKEMDNPCDPVTDYVDLFFR